LFLGESTKTAATRVAHFDSNVQQIVCRLRLRPRPHWGSLERSPRPLAVFESLFLKGGDEKEGERKGGSLSFALGRKRKVCTYGFSQWLNYPARGGGSL